MKQPYNTALYMRLSRDDENYGDSISIETQRLVLNAYARDQGFFIVDEYVDDGWSGTNFERPGFQRMLQDIEAGKVNCVLVKDLSRFGREHVMMDYYLEFLFPEKQIRFIAITDNEDTEKGLSDFVPFKNLFNENLSLRRAEQKQHRRTALGIKTGDSSSNVGDESSAFYTIVYFFHSGTSSVRVKLLFRLPRKLRDMPIKQKPCHTMMAGLYP